MLPPGGIKHGPWWLDDRPAMRLPGFCAFGSIRRPPPRRRGNKLRSRHLSQKMRPAQEQGPRLVGPNLAGRSTESGFWPESPVAPVARPRSQAGFPKELQTAQGAKQKQAPSPARRRFPALVLLDELDLGAAVSRARAPQEICICLVCFRNSAFGPGRGPVLPLAALRRPLNLSFAMRSPRMNQVGA